MMTYQNRDFSVLSTEYQLLLLCARSDITAEDAEMLRAMMAQTVNWQTVLNSAAQHGIMPLLYWNLNRLYPMLVPPAILKKLETEFLNNTRRNLLITSLLVNLLDQFEQAGIVAFPLKGPVLSNILYGNLVLRRFTDLDIFIPKADLYRSREIALTLGYTGPVLTRHLSNYPQHHFVMTHALSNSSLEIHWQLSSPSWRYPLSTDEIKARVKPMTLSGHKVYSFQDVDLILYISVHGASHYWYRLKWLIDFAECVRVYKEIHWETVLQRANLLGVERILLVNFMLANSLLGTPYPECIAFRLENNETIHKLSSAIEHNLISDKSKNLGFAEELVLRFALREHFRDRLAVLIFFLYKRIKLRDEFSSFAPLHAVQGVSRYLLRIFRNSIRYRKQIKLIMVGIFRFRK